MVRELDAEVPLYEVGTFEQTVSRAFWRQRLQGQVVGLFATMALVLAALGIYGVVSYGVAQRARELGIRAAIGATAGDLSRLVLGQGVVLAGLGIAIGWGWRSSPAAGWRACCSECRRAISRRSSRYRSRLVWWHCLRVGFPRAARRGPIRW